MKPGTKWTTIKGIARRFVSKIPVAKIVTFALATSLYNELRAEGLSPAEAAALTGLEQLNLVPIGVDDLVAGGKKYKAIVANSRLIALGYGESNGSVNSHHLRDPVIKGRNMLRREFDLPGITTDCEGVRKVEE